MTENKAERELSLDNIKIFINPNQCNSCGICNDVCPFALPIINAEGKYEIQRPDLCTECGACKQNCPTQAIYMQEKEGCGCLWDVRQKEKNKGKADSNSCGCGS